MLQIDTKYVDLKVSDGTSMRGYVARPKEKGKHPGILVFQEAFGVNGHIRSVAERFSKEGFVAIAPELFHRSAPGFEGAYNDFASARGQMEKMTVEGQEADFRAAGDWLKSQDDVDGSKMVCVGFCMGGRASFIAAGILPLKAAVSFYGGGIAPALLGRAASVQAPLLFFWGEKDTHISREQRIQVLESLAKHGKSYVNIDFADANHGFLCDQRESYHPASAKLAWDAMMSFFRLYLA